MKAKSIKGKSVEEIQSALQQCMSDARPPARAGTDGDDPRLNDTVGQAVGRGFTPTLAIVFLSVSQDRKTLCQIMEKEGIQVYGVTTNGEFTDENPEKLSTAVLLLEIDPAYFSIFIADYPERNYREMAKTIAARAKQTFARPAFLVSFSHIETDAEQLLFGIEDVIGKEVNVFGGGAGDDYAFKDQFVFTNQHETKQGMVVLVLDEDKIRIKGRATCGWKAIGTEKTVTRSEGNHVFTVDDVPVLDLTAKYGGLENVSPDNPNLLLEVAASLPLQLQREKGDPVMRPGLVVDWNDHSFYCSGSVPQGSKVKFSLPPDFDVMEKVVKAVEELKATEMPEADALIVFSCAGRIMSLGPLINQEIEGVKQVWNVPMVGMFSNAELGRATGGNLEMHNLTTCVVALKEK
jgi:hypothetical protein